jgi:hypothetical protein
VSRRIAEEDERNEDNLFTMNRSKDKDDSVANSTVPLTRRSAIIKFAAIGLSAAALSANKAHAELCQDPEELSSTDYSFRKYVEYTEAWKNPDESCRHCASFRPSKEESACGRCQAVGGSINPNGHCTGWERAKAAK